MGRRLLGLLATACAAACWLATPAAGELALWPCADNIDYACGRLTVPLDRSGAVPGTVGLALRRRRATVGDEKVAVLALAGGPGQESIQLASGFAQLIQPAIGTRDMIVFDQRGIGFSGPLHCAAIKHLADADNPPPSAATACGNQLGPTRDDYSTAATVADIEAIRVAGGYQQLVLYGTSYGTEVALDYARAYPSNVESMVLDSTVPPDGLDPFDRPTYAAIRRVLDQLCAGQACAAASSSPRADFATLVDRARRRAWRGRSFDARGHPHSVAITERNVFDILAAGDFDPTLRSDFPAAARAALNGDVAPLARLRDRALAGGSTDTGFDAALNVATTCDDINFPWSRGADPATRLRQAVHAARQLPATAIAPFDVTTTIGTAGDLLCSGWPYSVASAAPSGSLPNVPTLILSGADDVRTPTENARAIAAQIPDAHVVVVPGVGHSVLGTDLGPCATDAIMAFFANKKIRACVGQQSVVLPPTPLPPRHFAYLEPAHGVPGRAGRTATAVKQTLGDIGRMLTSLILSSGSPFGGFGGLRGGWARFSGAELEVHAYSYVPGITLTGKLLRAGDRLRVGGPDAAPGSLVEGSGGGFAGRLGGRHVHIGFAAIVPRLR
jgi:pimeloyl-ACP methyl ester carboxylesterase